MSVSLSVPKLSIAGVGEKGCLDFGVGVRGGEDIRSLLSTDPLVGVDCLFCGVEVDDRFSSRLKSFTIAHASRISFK